MSLTCREQESKILDDFLESDKAEFLALYGRRRVGKTFLIRTFFEKKNVIFLNTTGAKEGKLAEQIKHFTQVLGDVFYNGATLKEGKNWDETFSLLKKAVDGVPKNKKVVLFLDEFPWMATRKSRLLESVDYYWNQYFSQDKRIKLIICGSSSSWILDKIINNKGGLHNRITVQIQLEPLNLRDTKRFLTKGGYSFTTDQIVNIYLAMGGIPYYLMQLIKNLSAIQNIEQLAFSKKGFLIDEFDNLFASLFTNHDVCIEIIRAIAGRRYGIGQEELFKEIGPHMKGKLGLTKLKELENAGFIMSFVPYGNKEKGIYYRVIDEYTLFYLKWIEPVKNTLLRKSLVHGYWEKLNHTPAWYSWAGLAFESICYKHIAEISRALRISPTAIPATWRYVPHKDSKLEGAQIDLLFDRDDDAITICEIKFSSKPILIDKECAKKLLTKRDVFIKRTKTKKQIFIAIIASQGIKKGIYSDELISQVVTLDDLFSVIGH